MCRTKECGEANLSACPGSTRQQREHKEIIPWRIAKTRSVGAVSGLYSTRCDRALFHSQFLAGRLPPVSEGALAYITLSLASTMAFPLAEGLSSGRIDGTYGLSCVRLYLVAPAALGVTLGLRCPQRLEQGPSLAHWHQHRPSGPFRLGLALLRLRNCSNRVHPEGRDQVLRLSGSGLICLVRSGRARLVRRVCLRFPPEKASLGHPVDPAFGSPMGEIRSIEYLPR